MPGGRVENWSRLRQLISRGGSWYARTLLGLPIRDVTGGYKCFRASVLQQLDLAAINANGYGFQVEMNYRCHQAGFRIHEIPIVFPDRVAGQSKMSQQIVWEAAALVLRLRVSPNPYKRVRLARTKRERRKRGGKIVVQWGHRLLLDTSSADRVPAPLISEGTVLVLGLLTLLWTARPRLVLLEDVERGLHPAALAELVKQLRMLQQRDPGLQFVMTSHSPYLVDAFAPEEVWLMALGDDGAARTARLTEHPDFERWRGMMNPGEFWSTVGEAWVKAKPAAVNAAEAQAPEAAKDRG